MSSRYSDLVAAKALEEADDVPSLPTWFPGGRMPVVIPAAGKVVARQSDIVCDCLRRLIRSDGLRASDALPSERALSAVYGVARGSLRGALLRLREQGLVRIAHGQATRVTGRQPSWSLGQDETADVLCDLREWTAALSRARVAVAAATFGGDKQASNRVLLQCAVAALDLLQPEMPAASAVIAIDICHRGVVELSPPELRATLRAALQGMPMYLVRDALDAGLCTDTVRMQLFALQASWVDRNCEATKVAVLEYLTMLEALRQQHGLVVERNPDAGEARSMPS